MKVLLSIKPKYVKEIISGNKKYEFRKTIFKKRDTKKIYIYSSSPVKRIIGTFTPSDIIKDSPQKLWERFKDFSGLPKEDFFKYFSSKDEGFAIKISNLRVFKKPIDPAYIFENFLAPQSFCYIKNDNFIGEYWLEQKINFQNIQHNQSLTR